jgi:hypothetical protein
VSDLTVYTLYFAGGFWWVGDADSGGASGWAELDDALAALGRRAARAAKDRADSAPSAS